MKRTQQAKVETVTVGNAVVKIYKRTRPTITGGQRNVYEVSDYSAGVRRLRSFSDHAKARREAERVASQLATGEHAAANMLSTQVASFGRATELLRPTGLSLEMAAAIVAKCVEILEGDNLVEAARYFKQHGVDRLVRRTVAETVAELVEAKTARGKSARYVRNLKNHLTRFAQSFGVDISNVTGPDIQNWLDRLRVKPRTAKNFRGALFTLFAFAEARAYILRGTNPVETVEQVSTNGDGAIQIYTPEEIASLVKAASKDFLPVVLLGAFAGIRTAEIARLTWPDVDIVGGFVHVSAAQAKTRSRRLVPILPNLAAWLAPYTGKRGHVWKGDENDLQTARTETAAKAAVAWKPNGLRHSFISYRVADIQDVAKVALEAGNTSNVIFKNYRELVKPEAAKTWFAISPEAPANVLTLATAKAAQ